MSIIKIQQNVLNAEDAFIMNKKRILLYVFLFEFSSLVVEKAESSQTLTDKLLVDRFSLVGDRSSDA